MPTRWRPTGRPATRRIARVGCSVPKGSDHQIPGFPRRDSSGVRVTTGIPARRESAITTEGSRSMSQTRIHNFSISLDGFGTGEPQSREAPFGHAGERLHEWMFATRFWEKLAGHRDADASGGAGADNAFAERHEPGIGAEIMGANKFGPPDWQDDAERKGWWGPNPPFHTPVYVLTHRPRSSIELEGGTTFHFLDATPAEALEEAKRAAGDLDVRLGGGATVIREFLLAGLVDHMHLVHVPILLGPGGRLWDGLEPLEESDAIEAVSTPSGVTHLTF